MNYDRYFIRGQKVFLINISEERDMDVFNSFTGTVTVCSDDLIMVRTAYKLYSSGMQQLAPGMQFKLTTETMGMGVQARAELLSIVSFDELKLKPLGELSVYQRRQTARVDVTLPLLYVPQNSSLAAFQREWRRVTGDLRKPVPPVVKLKEKGINLSTGGMRIELESKPPALSLTLIDLKDDKPPVCAIAELVWHSLEEDQTEVRCGHRFVEILKEDQERLAAFIDKQTGVRTAALKQRELLDRMDP